MKKIVIAVDGYSACGKSTTARALAEILNYLYIDSGAMYRAVTLYFTEHHVSLTNPNEVEKALKNIEIDFVINPKTKRADTFLNGLNVEDKIRTMAISEKVSAVSALAEVRKAMVAQQRKLGKRKGVVMDGRDIGTVVFPDAELKIFMNADIYIRAKRRQREMIEKDQLIDLNEVMDNLQKRDEMDSTRAESPLRQAADAVVIDTSFLTFEEQLELAAQLATSKMIEADKQT